MEYKFSDKISSLQPSAIREILKATSVPGMIALAAGNPAPDAFPIDAIREIAKDNNVPIVENRPVARTLYNTVPVDGMIPSDMYVAVAEILAYVFRQKNGEG